MFCVGKKIKGAIVVPRLLKLKQIAVQASCFKFIMNHNVEAMIREPSNVNPITQMWLKIQFSPLLVLKLSEYMNVVEIVVLQVLGLIADERTFNNLTFLKSKLHNQLTTHFNLCCACSPKVFTMSLIF
jgi:hypothetical protein